MVQNQPDKLINDQIIELVASAEGSEIKLVKQIISIIKEFQEEEILDAGHCYEGFYIFKKFDAVKFPYTFKPPMDIQLLGVSNTLRSQNIEFLLLMPINSYKESDRLNYKYFVKQNLYTCLIAQKLYSIFLKEPNPYKINLETSGFNNDSLNCLWTRLIIDINSADCFIQILINICPQTSQPSINIDEIKKFNPKKFLLSAINSQKCVLYDFTMANLIMLPYNIDICTNAFKTYPRSNLYSTFRLLKIWAQLANIINCQNLIYLNLNAFLQTFLLWLSKHDKISSQMGIFEMFELTLTFLSSYQSFVNGYTFNSSHEFLALYKMYNCAICLDAFGFSNILYQLTKFDLTWMCHEAEIYCKYLKTSTHPEPFTWLFRVRKSFELSFDYVFRLQIPFHAYKKHLAIHTNRNGADETILEESIVQEDMGSIYRALKLRILNILARGLEPFLKMIVLKPAPYVKIPLKSDGDLDTQHLESRLIKMTFGLLLNTTATVSDVWRTNDSFALAGPIPDSVNPDAEKSFINFWGKDHTTLRRWKDGTVRYIATLPLPKTEIQNSQSNLSPIVSFIIKHLLIRHCAFDCFPHWAKHFDCNAAREFIEKTALSLKVYEKPNRLSRPSKKKNEIPKTDNSKNSSNFFPPPKQIPYGNGDQFITPVIKTTEKLIDLLKSDTINDVLPLKIAKVTPGFDAISRKTEVFPPLPIKTSLANKIKNNRDFSIKSSRTLKISQNPKFSKNGYHKGVCNNSNYSSRNQTKAMFKAKRIPPFHGTTTIFVWPENSYKWPTKVDDNDINVECDINDRDIDSTNNKPNAKASINNYKRTKRIKDDQKNTSFSEKRCRTGERLTYTRALHRLSLAFLIELKNILTSHVTRCHLICPENGRRPLTIKNSTYKWDNFYLEVLYGEYLFKICFICPPLLDMYTPKLLRRPSNANNQGQSGHLKNDVLELIQKLCSALTSIQSKFPAFASTARLCKRWLASNMLLSCDINTDISQPLFIHTNKTADSIKYNSNTVTQPLLNEIWVDVLISSLFLCPEPYDHINSGVLGFFRFIRLLSMQDWKDELLFIPLFTYASPHYNSLNENDQTFASLIKTIKDAFTQTHRLFKASHQNPFSTNTISKSDKMQTFVLDYGILDDNKAEVNEASENTEADLNLLTSCPITILLNQYLSPSLCAFKRATMLASQIYNEVLNGGADVENENIDISVMENKIISDDDILDMTVYKKRNILNFLPQTPKERKNFKEFRAMRRATLKNKLFKPRLQDFDFTIQLRRSKISRLHQNIHKPIGIYKQQFINLPITTKLDDPSSSMRFPKTEAYLADFDPVQTYLLELQKNFAFYAIFFYDKFGGDTIGAVWRPKVFDKIIWSPRNANFSPQIPRYLVPSQLLETNNIKNAAFPTSILLPDTGSEYVYDIASIIQDITLLGQGLISSVILKSERWA